MRNISEEDLRLTKFAGFNKRFEEELKNHRTYQSAFDWLNDYYEKTFGERRYSDYDSFSRVRRRKIKKQKN